jgi:hypothetical protein
MRLNRILTGLACMLLLAGIGAAVELFGGNTVNVANNAGGAAGGPYISLDNALPNQRNLELGVEARAWVTGSGAGNASAAFNGSGSASAFRNTTTQGIANSDSRGFLQTVSYSGRVQTKAVKTSTTAGTIDTYAVVYANSTAAGSANAKATNENATVAGEAGIFTSIGRHNFADKTDRQFNATGTATAVASGSASDSTEYINKSQTASSGASVRTTSVKATGEVSGETYLTAENKKNTFGKDSGNTSGEASIYTTSSASAVEATGSRSYSELYAEFNASSGVKDSANTINGFVNATKANSYAWDTNRTSTLNSTNYNAYSNVIGVLNGGAKAFEAKDRANTTAKIVAEAIHKRTTFNASGNASTTTEARRLGENNATRVEGTAFVNNAVSNSITQGRLGATTATKKNLKAESSFKTLGSLTANGAGDNIGGGIFLSNLTSTAGFSTNSAYTQKAVWDNNLKQFGLTTDFKVVNKGMNFSTNVGDTGAIGTVLTIMNNSKLLSDNYGTRVNSTNMATQKNWNWYASTNGVLNQGGVIDAPTFVATGTTPINSQTYVGRVYTRQFDTSNPS